MSIEQQPNWWQVKNPDQLASKMTKREQFCLAMRVPKTGDAELDAIIREGNRLEFAKSAMQGILANSESSANPELCAILSLRYGNALLAELEKAR